jgi:predicted ATPase
MPTNKDKDPVLRLDTLRVKGFRSLADATVKLSPLQVVIGPNGVGKSNVLSALRLLQAIARQGLRSYTGGVVLDQLFFRGFDHTKHIELEAEFRGMLREERTGVDEFGEPTTELESIDLHERYRVRLSIGGDKRLYIVDEFVDLLGADEPMPVGLSVSTDEANLRDSAAPAAKRIYQVIDGWRLFHFHNTSAGAPLRGAWRANDDFELHDHGGNLGPVLARLSRAEPQRYRAIVAEVRRVFPRFDTFVFADSEEATVPVRWREKGSTHVFGIDELSDGTLRFLAIATALLQYSGASLLGFDEPELGLHPAALSVLGGLLVTQARDRDIVLATQSAAMLDQVANIEDVIVAHNEWGDGTALRRLTRQEFGVWLKEYTVGELWLMNVLGGRP